MHGVAVTVSRLTLNSCASDTEYYSNGLIGLFLIWFDYASGLHFKETQKNNNNPLSDSIGLDFVKRKMSKESSFRH